MIIRGKTASSVGDLYAQRLQATDATRKATAAAGASSEAAATSQQGRDGIEISAEAQALQKATEAAMAADDVHWDKVAQLRQQVEQGTYNVPVEGLVQRLLGEA
jgi:flagellar biosynthesis anti-sigma factor FlgM